MTTPGTPLPPATPDPVPPTPQATVSHTPMGDKKTKATGPSGSPVRSLVPPGRGDKEPRKDGARGRKPVPITWYLRCPQCLHLQVEQMYRVGGPSHLRCGACDKVIPTAMWLVAAYQNLGGYVARMKDRLGRPPPTEVAAL